MSAARGRLAKLRRIQDLFVEGKIIVLIDKAGDKTPLWVAKPSGFEKDEASKDGRNARAKRALLYDRDPDEQATVDNKLTELTTAEVIEALVSSEGNTFYVKALDSIRADKAWQERIEALDRGDALLADQPQNSEDEDVRSRLDAERALMRELHVEYTDEIQRLTDSYAQAKRDELGELDIEKLHHAYRAAWREMAATQSFLEERRITELFFAVRDCEATEDVDVPEDDKGRWNHSQCNSHLATLAEHRHQVHEFPDVLVAMARDALIDLQMTPQEAGNSDAPASSSASSEQHDEGEGSTASTPSGTQLEPAGT